MVKKKSPIVPLTFVVIGVAVAFVVNSRLRPVDPKQAQDDAMRAQQSQQEGVTRKEDKTQDVRASMMATAASGDSGRPGHKQIGPGGPAGGDMMVGNKPKAFKPMPNSAPTNALWYKKD